MHPGHQQVAMERSGVIQRQKMQRNTNMTKRDTEVHPQTSDKAILFHTNQGDGSFSCEVQKGTTPLMLVMIKEENFKLGTQKQVKGRGDMSMLQGRKVDLDPHVGEADNFLSFSIMCLLFIVH